MYYVITKLTEVNEMTVRNIFVLSALFLVMFYRHIRFNDNKYFFTHYHRLFSRILNEYKLDQDHFVIKLIEN